MTESVAGSLWGNLDEAPPPNTPSAIFKDQARVLAPATGHRLRGEVSSTLDGTRVRTLLRIVAPLLNEYRFDVAYAEYSIMGYPAELKDASAGESYECPSEREFRTHLASILQSDTTRKVIATLIRESGG